MKQLILIFLFAINSIFSQEILPEIKCDSLLSGKLTDETFLIENGSCGLTKVNFSYFTSYKEFSDYYNGNDYSARAGCRSQFNNFNFKMYNMVLINFDYSKSDFDSYSVDIKCDSSKFYIFFTTTKNKNTLDILIPAYVNKCISLPKDKSKETPIVIFCKL